MEEGRRDTTTGAGRALGFVFADCLALRTCPLTPSKNQSWLFFELIPAHLPFQTSPHHVFGMHHHLVRSMGYK